MSTPRREDVLRTTDTSLRLIEHIAELDGARLGELAAETGHAKSTVHDHLRTLAAHGYVVREGDTYHVGLILSQYGEYARKRRGVYKTAKSVVSELAAETQMGADFTVEENGRIVSVYDETGYSDTPSFFVDSRLFQVHSSASGKAILAEYPEHRVREIVDQWGLPTQTDNTITSMDGLFAELKRVREQGYGTNIEEAIEGLWAIGMAVKRPNGEVCGSLNAVGPTYIYDETREAELADLLREKVTTFERQLVEQRD